MWSAAVFDSAFPGRSRATTGSPVPSSPRTPCTPSTTMLPTCTNAGLTTWPCSSGTIPDSMSASAAFPGVTSAWTTPSAPGPPPRGDRRPKTATFAHVDYPHVRQTLQIVCWRRDLSTRKLTIERIYLVTGLPPGAATGSEFAAWFRGHWHIENQHHVRDHTFHEDASNIRTRNLPRVMAGLRNLGVGIHRQDGHTNIAAALRHTARDHLRAPHRPRTGLTNHDTRSLLKAPGSKPAEIRESSAVDMQARRFTGSGATRCAPEATA